MVPLEIETCWPVVIDVEFRIISVADVPTVNPSAITVVPPSFILATAAVPVCVAFADFGTPCIVIRVLGFVPLRTNDGSDSGIETSTAAYAAVQISKVAGDACASIALITASILLFCSACE